MKIEDMHVWFRQYAQQMGMQNVRAILPEQIDIFINTSIMDMVNEIVKSNIGIKTDRIIGDSSKILQLNSLRSLYTVKEIDLLTSNPIPFIYDVANHFNGRYSLNTAYTLPDAMYWVDFSLNYCKVTSGWTTQEVELDPVGKPGIMTTMPKAPVRMLTTPANGDIPASVAFTTNFYPVRFVEDAFLADTLNDFVLKPRLRSPIIIVYTGAENKVTFDIYIDQFDKVSGMLRNSLAPYTFRVSYIAKPATVAYDEDVAGSNVDCNLPEYLHGDILKHAVDLYRASISGNLIADQEAGKQQQREDYRNRDVQQ